MTQDEIIEMARQAGLFTHREVQPEIVAFAKLVAEKALAQRTWVGLTDEERHEILVNAVHHKWDDRKIVKDIEAKLKEKNNGQ